MRRRLFASLEEALKEAREVDTVFLVSHADRAVYVVARSYNDALAYAARHFGIGIRVAGGSPHAH